MVKTMRDFEDKVRELKRDLDAMNSKGFLNEVGQRTLDAYNAILRTAPFYDDLKEFAASEKVQTALEEYKDCRELAHMKWFLEKELTK